jgi:hypothetical protein
VQPKNPVKEDSEISDDIFPGTDGPVGSGTSTASTTLSPQPGDLHIASSSPYIAGSTPNTSSSTQTISDLTLDLTPPVSLNPDIPNDLIVPPFSPETVTSDIDTTQ